MLALLAVVALAVDRAALARGSSRDAPPTRSTSESAVTAKDGRPEPLELIWKYDTGG